MGKVTKGRKTDLKTKTTLLHKCQICDRVFGTSYHAERHAGTHDFSGSQCKVMCTICHKRCRTTGDLKIHMMVHSDNRPFGCDHCDARFKRAGALKKHLTVLHNSKEYPAFGKIHQCPDCNKSFSSITHLQRHGEAHLGDNRPKPFFCEGCSKSFSEKHHLTRHVKTFHIVETKWGCHCPKCGKKFMFKKDLKNCECSKGKNSAKRNTRVGKKCTFSEKRKKYPAFGKKHQCPDCDKSFSNIFRLRKHQEIHLGINRPKPFVCEGCGQSFSEKHHLTRHVKTFHIGDTKWGCHCSECGLLFMFKKQLKQHICSKGQNSDGTDHSSEDLVDNGQVESEYKAEPNCDIESPHTETTIKYEPVDEDYDYQNGAYAIKEEDLDNKNDMDFQVDTIELAWPSSECIEDCDN